MMYVSCEDSFGVSVSQCAMDRVVAFVGSSGAGKFDDELNDASDDAPLAAECTNGFKLLRKTLSRMSPRLFMLQQ